ncbi:type II toxin-antitoxin system Phd/YefM family antitoxin [Leptotrichia alba]|uniref:Antitoxin n=1 Tax=Leptotrichia alba TaxID=3239304 RepID=A0AB39V2V4_9FUSO
MKAINFSKVRNNLKNYCDTAIDENEEIIVTRKDERNVVILSLEKYNQLLKDIHNAKYLAKLDLAYEQMLAGKVKTHDLIEVDDD